MRRILFIAALLAGPGLMVPTALAQASASVDPGTASRAIPSARVRFLQPLEGSQLVGPQWIEVATEATGIDRAEFYIDGVLAGVARKTPWRIAHDFGTSLQGHEISVKVYSHGYQSIDTARLTTAALTAGESITVDLVEVPVRLRAPRVVTPADLRVRENGVEQTIRELRPERGAAKFVFVVDRSLSMGEGRLQAALRAVDLGLHDLRPGDSAAVVLFNHNVSRARPMAPGEKIAAVFDDIVPSGGTSLRDALSSISSSDRVYAIVITDGGDRNSELSDEEALRRISGTRIVVDAIVLGRGSGFLDRAARNTGGTVVEAGRDSIDRALHGLILDINSRYLLAYQSHGTKRGWRSIQLTPRSGGVEIVNARKGYFAR